MPSGKCQGTGGSLGSRVVPWSGRAGPGSPSHPTPARSRADGGTRAFPVPDRHLPGDGLRLGCNVSPWVRVGIKPGEGKQGETCPPRSGSILATSSPAAPNLVASARSRGCTGGPDRQENQNSNDRSSWELEESGKLLRHSPFHRSPSITVGLHNSLGNVQIKITWGDFYSLSWYLLTLVVLRLTTSTTIFCYFWLFKYNTAHSMIAFPFPIRKEGLFWMTGQPGTLWFDFFGFFDGMVFLTSFQKTVNITFHIQVFLCELLDTPILQALKYIRGSWKVS